MQYHYIVFYDSQMDEWRVEDEMTYNFLDGNVFNPDDFPAQGSWFFAEEGSNEQALDDSAISMLRSYIGNIPTPVNVEA